MATSRSRAWSPLWIYAFALGLGVGQPRAGSAAVALRPAVALSRAEACRALTEALATALRDPALRGRLWVALEASPVPEHKLHLGRLLEGSRPLREAMQAATSHELSTLLGRAGNLELYLPVPGHRGAWRGGEELVVATGLDDREGPLYAVGVDGAAVALSAESPPAQPVLGLVPAESFRGDGEPLFVDLSPGDSAGTTTALTGLWATEIKVDDWTRYESWLWGLPELELHVQDARSRQLVACVEGTRSIAPRRLELASDAPQRPVLLGTASELPLGSAFLIAVVENDGAPCRLEAERDVEREVASGLGASRGRERAIFETRAHAETVAYAPTELPVAAAARALGGDEVVGLVTGRVEVGSTPQGMFIKDELFASAGTVVLQHKTETLY